MVSEEWEVLEEVAGSFQAEILRGFLEAQEISVVLSQEGAGHSVYPVTMGLLGRVQVLVPAKDLERARLLLEEYKTGAFSDQEFPEERAPEEHAPQEDVGSPDEG